MKASLTSHHTSGVPSAGIASCLASLLRPPRHLHSHHHHHCCIFAFHRSCSPSLNTPSLNPSRGPGPAVSERGNMSWGANALGGETDGVS